MTEMEELWTVDEVETEGPVVKAKLVKKKLHKCKICGEPINTIFTNAIVTVNRKEGEDIKSRRYYLCEAHANELEFHFLLR